MPMDLQAQRLFSVVIDAGHGGKDPGTVGNGGKEKEITLAVAKLVGKKIKASHPEVRVLFTRETDVFVGLQARADFANKHKASLMLSIHVNSAPTTSVHGTETYVLGLSKFANNLSVAMTIRPLTEALTRRVPRATLCLTSCKTPISPRA